MHIFFDLDDTLLDSSTAEQAAAYEFALSHPEALGRDPAAFIADWQRVSAEYYARWTNGELAFREQRRERIRHYWGASLSDEAAGRLFTEYLALYETHWAAYPDVLPCLEQLASWPLGIITNGEPLQQNAKLQALGVAHFFSLVITPQEADGCKPHTAIFDYAAAAAGVPPGECIYIGDLLEDDACAAGQAGWLGIWLNRSQINKTTKIPMIHTLLELPELLTSIR